MRKNPSPKRAVKFSILTELPWKFAFASKPSKACPLIVPLPDKILASPCKLLGIPLMFMVPEVCAWRFWICVGRISTGNAAIKLPVFILLSFAWIEILFSPMRGALTLKARFPLSRSCNFPSRSSIKSGETKISVETEPKFRWRKIIESSAARPSTVGFVKFPFKVPLKARFPANWAWYLLSCASSSGETFKTLRMRSISLASVEFKARFRFEL